MALSASDFDVFGSLELSENKSFAIYSDGMNELIACEELGIGVGLIGVGCGELGVGLIGVADSFFKIS
jgi:hypothetical protein